MRSFIVTALAAALAGVACHDAASPKVAPQFTGQNLPPGSLTAVVRGQSPTASPADSAAGGVLVAGATARVYQQEVTQCDTLASPPSCTTQPVQGAVDVPLPGGGTARGALTATVTTDASGTFLATKLPPGAYLVVVAPPTGSAFGSASAQGIPVASGKETAWGVIQLPAH